MFGEALIFIDDFMDKDNNCPLPRWLYFLETFIVGLLSPSVFSSAYCLCVEEVTLGLAGQRDL